MNRWLLLLLVLIILLLGAGDSTGVEPHDWPRWRGQDGYGGWKAPEFDGTWPSDQVQQIWSQPIGPGYSGIAVADGRVFTQDRDDTREEERIICLDAISGDSRWEYRYPAAYGDLDYGKGPRATPLIVDGRVYTMGAVGDVLCLEADSGTVVWHQQVKQLGARQPMWGFAASPIMHRNKLILHIGAENGCYVALNPADGEVLWRGGSDSCGYATPIIIEHAGSELLIGWTPEHIMALDPESGKVHWKIEYPVTYGVSIASPIYHEGIVFVSGYWEGSKAIRLGSKPTDAELVWEDRRAVRGLMAQPLFRNGYVYVLDKEQGIVCCELKTGKVLWTDENTLTPPGRNPHASIVWAGDQGQVLALNSSGELVLASFTPEGYREVGRTPIVGETWAHPAFSGPFVFARDDQQIVCVRVSR